MRFIRSVGVAVLWLVIVGCQQPATTTGSPTASGADSTASGSRQGIPSGGGGQWAIVLDAYNGPNHQLYAQQQAQAFAQAGGLEGFWCVDEGERSVVYFGHYASASDARAQRDIRALRELASSGRLRARTVTLSPVIPPRSQLDPMDLRSIEIPDAVYTLQVGVFDEAYGADYRKAAEQAASEYRTGGEEAYFYHGPHQSLVTIGIFGHAAATVEQEGPNRGQPVYHPYIQELQRTRHPYLIVNGQTVLGTDPNTGKEVRLPSFLVRIPE